MTVAAEPRRPNTRHRASPRARRLLREAGLRQPDVAGSGPEGRILAADVESVVAAAAPPDVGTEGGVEAVQPKPSPVAATIVFMAVEVDYFGIDRVRRSAARVTLERLAFVARAVIDALAAFPYLNAQVDEQTRPVHLGVTVDLTPGGLVTPVVRDADRLRLTALAQQISAMTDRARAGDLDAEDTEGATFTVSDAGPYGTLLTAPVLGSDQAAALAIGSVQAKPVAIEREPGEYVVAVHPVGTLGLSFDHHAIDTGYAAGFLDRVREALETRDWSTEL